MGCSASVSKTFNIFNSKLMLWTNGVTLTVSTLATYLLKHPLSNSAVDVRRAAFCPDDTHTMKIIQAVLCAGKMVELLRGKKEHFWLLSLTFN